MPSPFQSPTTGRSPALPSRTGTDLPSGSRRRTRCSTPCGRRRRRRGRRPVTGDRQVAAVTHHDLGDAAGVNVEACRSTTATPRSNTPSPSQSPRPACRCSGRSDDDRPVGGVSGRWPKRGRRRPLRDAVADEVARDARRGSSGTAGTCRTRRPRRRTTSHVLLLEALLEVQVRPGRVAGRPDRASRVPWSTLWPTPPPRS